jgi:hypothetical protein
VSNIAKSIADQVSGLTYKAAVRHVFQLRHVSSKEDMAWCSKRRVWTSVRMGTVYSYNEAVDGSISGRLPDEGRWFAIGEMLYSVE